MTEDDEESGVKASTYVILPPPADPNGAKLPYKTMRPKRRRKGQLNDGQWAPGYGPDAKKKRDP